MTQRKYPARLDLLYLLTSKVLQCHAPYFIGDFSTTAVEHSDLFCKNHPKISFCLKRYRRLPFIHQSLLDLFINEKIYLFFFISNRLIYICTVLPYKLKGNVAFHTQYSLYHLILLKIMVLHIRKPLSNK